METNLKTSKLTKTVKLNMSIFLNCSLISTSESVTNNKKLEYDYKTFLCNDSK